MTIGQFIGEFLEKHPDWELNIQVGNRKVRLIISAHDPIKGRQIYFDRFIGYETVVYGQLDFVAIELDKIIEGMEDALRESRLNQTTGP